MLRPVFAFNGNGAQVNVNVTLSNAKDRNSNLVNAKAADKPLAPAAIKDAAQWAGAQIVGEPPSPEKVAGAKRNTEIDHIARKAKQLPREERRDYVRNELEKRGMWDSKARARLGRMYPGLYKYED